MKRALVSTATVLFFIGILLGPALAAEKVLRFPHTQTTDHPYQIGLLKVADVIKQKTNGRIEIKLFPGSQLGNDPDILEQMSMGSVDFGIMGGAWLGTWHAPFGIFDAGYVFENLEQMYKFADTAAAQEMFNALRAKRGIRILDTWYFGTRQLTTNKSVRTPDDLKGVKIRAVNNPLSIATVRALGANATPMAFPEVYMGLSQGIMDGQENPLPTIVGNKFYEVQKFLILTGHQIQATFVLMSEKTFQSLSPQDQAIVQDTVKSTRSFYNNLMLEQEMSYLKFVQDKGVKVVTPDLEPFRAKALKELPPQFDSQWGKGLYEKIRQMK